MAGAGSLRVILLKPSKYAADGWVERFRWGFLPNSTVRYLASLTPERVAGVPCQVHAIDEYVQTDLAYLELLEPSPGARTLLALVGVQSHQLHRALDLAAYARQRGCSAVIGGPHPMTCDTADLQGRGVSFALSEAELVWPAILADAARGELRPLYGGQRRWQERLEAPVVSPPSRRDLARYVVPMLGVYPARGCPYSCNFCSVIKIAGHRIRSQPVETTLATLRGAKAAGVRVVLFTSDNFNKYSEVETLLEAMIAERIRLPFFAQCDAQIERQPKLVELLARAGCFQIFVGAESFSVETLRQAHKFHNTPARYAEIVRLCREHRVSSHFSNILGFPSDTEQAIREHLATLMALSPDVASFYILTPIPGTEQYDEFLAHGWITELNLDRFDGTTVTWRHPRLPAARLTELLFACYRGFYAWPGVARRTLRFARGSRDFRTGETLYAVAGSALQARIAVRNRAHPMAGGTWPVRVDRAEDYRHLRRQVFGLELAPLPRSLALSHADEELNRTAKLTGS
jgi:Radical SAM superfamily